MQNEAGLCRIVGENRKGAPITWDLIQKGMSAKGYRPEAKLFHIEPLADEKFAEDDTGEKSFLFLSQAVWEGRHGSLFSPLKMDNKKGSFAFVEGAQPLFLVFPQKEEPLDGWRRCATIVLSPEGRFGAKEIVFEFAHEDEKDGLRITNRTEARAFFPKKDRPRPHLFSWPSCLRKNCG